MSLEEALQILKTYSCLQIKIPQSPEDKISLRTAIRTVSQASEYENLGVCCDTLTQGIQGIKEYLSYLGYQIPPQLDEIELKDEPSYLKFNTKKMSCYVDSYNGDYRGVLIACLSDDPEIGGTYGYFPLDLFKQE